MSKAADLLGFSPQGLRQTWLPSLSESDVRRNKRPIEVNVPALVERMILARVEEAAKARVVSSGDPLLDGGESPALERYRLAKAKHAELDLAHRKGELIDVEKSRSIMLRWGKHLRRAGELIGRKCTECHEILAESLRECEEIIDDELKVPPKDDQE